MASNFNATQKWFPPFVDAGTAILSGTRFLGRSHVFKIRVQMTGRLQLLIDESKERRAFMCVPVKTATFGFAATEFTANTVLFSLDKFRHLFISRLSLVNKSSKTRKSQSGKSSKSGIKSRPPLPVSRLGFKTRQKSASEFKSRLSSR